MTREEAIQAIGNLIDMNIRYHCDTQWIDALRMAIEALKGGDAEMQTIAKTPDYMQQSPSDGADLISRADAMAYIERVINSGLGRNKSLDYIHKYISALPSADRPHGEWTSECACSLCGCQPWYERDIHTLNYCPNCGADMRGEST